jgi:3-oxoacyl-[acyl-carrier protein] reductase
MKIIRGKKALVTGAGSGIGRAIALALAREGAGIALLGRDKARLEAAAAEVRSHGVEAIVVRCDISEPAQISAAVQTILSQWGRLDILVNNAGLAYYGPTEQMRAEQVRQILATNLLAPIQLVQELLPTFIAQREAHILNVSSIFGLVTMRKGAAYQSTKFGLIGFSNTIRVEYRRRGIGVSVLCPGFVRTPMLQNFAISGEQPGRHSVPDFVSITPERVAEVAIRAIRKNKGLVVISAAARLMWWVMRLSPWLYDWLMREGWRK